MRDHTFLFTVTDRFAIEGRGVVVVPGIPLTEGTPAEDQFPTRSEVDKSEQVKHHLNSSLLSVGDDMFQTFKKMAHADGWINAYGCLEEGRPVPDSLKEKVMSNCNELGETMLHWYAIEGDPEVVEKIIDLGFDVNTTNKLSQTPLFECVQINRWDMVELLLRRGADTSIKDKNDEDLLEYLEGIEEHAKSARLKKLTRRLKE